MTITCQGCHHSTAWAGGEPYERAKHGICLRPLSRHGRTLGPRFRHDVPRKTPWVSWRMLASHERSDQGAHHWQDLKTCALHTAGCSGCWHGLRAGTWPHPRTAARGGRRQTAWWATDKIEGAGHNRQAVAHDAAEACKDDICKIKCFQLFLPHKQGQVAEIEEYGRQFRYKCQVENCEKSSSKSKAMGYREFSILPDV